MTIYDVGREVLVLPPHAYGHEESRYCQRGTVASLLPAGVLVHTESGDRLYSHDDLAWPEGR